MWSEVMATGTRGWNWIERTDTYNPAGSNKDGRVVYENLKVLVVKDDKMRVSRSKGMIINEYLHIILPIFQLNSDELEEPIRPTIDRTFFTDGTHTYKVIGILDYTANPEYFTYHLTLKRESIR